MDHIHSPSRDTSRNDAHKKPPIAAPPFGEAGALRAACALLIAAAFSTCALAQKSPAKPENPPPQAGADLPKAETILDGYVEATGGKKAYAKLKTRIASGRFAVESMGIKGRTQTWQKAPNLFLSRVEMGEIGTSQRGYDGRTAWEKSALTGLRKLDGAERAFFIREATFNADLNWRDLSQKADTVGVEIINGQPAYKVEVTLKDGPKQTHYYDQYSQLLVRLDGEVKTEMGMVAVEVYPSDYKKVSGVLIPHKSTQKMLGITQVAEYEKIEFNKPVKDEIFNMPKGGADDGPIGLEDQNDDPTAREKGAKKPAKPRKREP